MKISIRRGVFETNSSSTHSLTICTEDEFNKWKNGEMYLTYDGLETKEDIMKTWIANKKRWYPEEYANLSEEEIIKEFEKDFEESSYEYKTYEYWQNEESCLESYFETYTTPGGEKICVFGEYGYDG